MSNAAGDCDSGALQYVGSRSQLTYIPVSLIFSIADIAADLWLLGAPVYMMLLLKLPRNHTRLILCIFATGILTTAAGIVHCVYIFLNKGMLVGMTGHLEVRSLCETSVAPFSTTCLLGGHLPHCVQPARCDHLHLPRLSEVRRFD